MQKELYLIKICNCMQKELYLIKIRLTNQINKDLLRIQTCAVFNFQDHPLNFCSPAYESSDSLPR